MTDLDLPNLARRVYPRTERDQDTTSWNRAKDASLEGFERRDERGRFSVAFDEGEQHDVILVEDSESFVGWCDCDGFAFHQDEAGGACAHICLVAQANALSDVVPTVEDVDVESDQEAVEEARAADGASGDVVATVPASEPQGSTVEDVDPEPVDADIVGEAGGASLPDPFADSLGELPERFIMELDGQPYIRREGYAVLARREGLTVETELVTWASETGFEAAEARAVVRDDDGHEWTGSATAHAATEDLRGAEGNLNELAETRAVTRALSWATGAGMSATEATQGPGPREGSA